MSRPSTQHKRATYPVYRPSGMDWVGDIPEHWEIHRLKHVASVQFSSVDKHTLEGEEPVRLCNYVDVYYNDFITADIEFMSASATQSEVARFQLGRGDVLVTKDSESWDDIAVPSYVAEKLEGVLCGYHLAHIRPHPRKLLGEYLFRAFRSRGINDQFRIAANGITRFGLGKYWLDNGLFPVPSLEEQRSIAAFLDRATVRIDALIEKKERQIELLQEKRSALISHAVTKGLNSSAPMKDSRFEWLGKIPRHWQVLPIKRVARMESGHTPDKKVEEYWTDCKIPWVSLNDTAYLKEHDYIEDTAFHVNELGLANSSAHLLPAHAVLFTRDATIGLSAITKQPMAVSQHIIAWICGSRIIPEYLLRVFYSMTQELERMCMGSTIRTLGMPDVLELVTPLPPVEEQQRIVNHLVTEVPKLVALEGKVQESIRLLIEHRAALISAAITGKIDVRDSIEQGPKQFKRG